MTKKGKKTAGILAAVLMTAAVAATAITMAGCNSKKVLYETSFATDVGNVSFTFYSNKILTAECAYTPINGDFSWDYGNDEKTQIKFNWGEQDSPWTVDILSVDGEEVAMYCVSDSMLPGPYVGFLSGITGAFVSENQLMNKDVVLILRDDKTTTVKSAVGTSTTSWSVEKQGDDNIITVTTDQGNQTGTVTYDGGFIKSIQFDKFIAGPNTFTPITASVK